MRDAKEAAMRFKDPGWGYVKAGLVGAVVAAVVMMSFPVVAAVGGNFILGQTNTADGVTSLAGAADANLRVVNTQPRGVALDLRVLTGAAPLMVNSRTRVIKLNSDLLDGKHASYFSPTTHSHAGVYLPVGGQAADSDLLDGQDASAFARLSHTHSASALVSGTLSAARFSAYSDLGVEGLLNNDSPSDLLTRTQADGRFLGMGATAADANLLDGLDSAAFSLAAHSHTGVYLPIGGMAANSSLLDGLDSTAFSLAAHSHDASVVISGTLDAARYSAYSDLGLEGYLNNDAADDLLTRSQADGRFLGIGATAADSNLLDGLDAAAFSLAAHSHDASVVISGTLDAARYSAYSDLGLEGYLSNDGADDLLTRSQADTRFLNEGDTAADSSLLDGLDSAAFAATGHDHDAEYLGISNQAADSARLGGSAPSLYYGGRVADRKGLPLLGATCLLQGGRLLGLLRDGSAYCSRAGGGGFTDSAQSLGNSNSIDVALGDLDADGDLDAFVATFGGPNLVWRNNGSGQFTDTGQTLGNAESTDVALGDLDGDGDIDAFVSTRDGSKVWVNDGSGTFADSGQTLGTIIGFGVALGDLDSDGDLDAFVTSDGASRVWLNDGSGAFTDYGQALGDPGWAVALGDLDGDGDLDALVSSVSSGNHVWFNAGTGAFTSSGQELGSYISEDVALGDLDGDGDLDAYFANNNQTNVIWLNNGSGTFAYSSQDLGRYQSRAIALADLDGDGDLDAYIANWEQPNRVWRNNGSGIFTDGGPNLDNHLSWGVALGDLDADGDLDVYVANFGQSDQVAGLVP